jgi:hypothetical protein
MSIICTISEYNTVYRRNIHAPGYLCDSATQAFSVVLDVQPAKFAGNSMCENITAPGVHPEARIRTRTITSDESIEKAVGYLHPTMQYVFATFYTNSKCADDSTVELIGVRKDVCQQVDMVNSNAPFWKATCNEANCTIAQYSDNQCKRLVTSPDYRNATGTIGKCNATAEVFVKVATAKVDAGGNLDIQLSSVAKFNRDFRVQETTFYGPGGEQDCRGDFYAKHRTLSTNGCPSSVAQFECGNALPNNQISASNVHVSSKCIAVSKASSLADLKSQISIETSSRATFYRVRRFADEYCGTTTLKSETMIRAQRVYNAPTSGPCILTEVFGRWYKTPVGLVHEVYHDNECRALNREISEMTFTENFGVCLPSLAETGSYIIEIVNDGPPCTNYEVNFQRNVLDIAQ